MPVDIATARPGRVKFDKAEAEWRRAEREADKRRKREREVKRAWGLWDGDRGDGIIGRRFRFP